MAMRDSGTAQAAIERSPDSSSATTVLSTTNARPAAASRSICPGLSDSWPDPLPMGWAIGSPR
jgi:hypothetical protein